MDTMAAKEEMVPVVAALPSVRMVETAAQAETKDQRASWEVTGDSEMEKTEKTEVTELIAVRQEI